MRAAMRRIEHLADKETAVMKGWYAARSVLVAAVHKIRMPVTATTLPVCLSHGLKDTGHDFAV